MPARSSAALMARPPRSDVENDAQAPDSFPMVVRAPATITEPGIGPPLAREGPIVRTRRRRLPTGSRLLAGDRVLEHDHRTSGIVDDLRRIGDGIAERHE